MSTTSDTYATAEEAIRDALTFIGDDWSHVRSAAFIMGFLERVRPAADAVTDAQMAALQGRHSTAPYQKVCRHRTVTALHSEDPGVRMNRCVDCGEVMS